MGNRLIRVLQPRLASLYRHALAQGGEIGLQGDIEPLHRYRVALRKLRSLLKLYRTHLPVEPVQALLASVGKQARVSNEMRDLDVFAASLENGHPLAPQVQRWRTEAFTRMFLALGELKRERQLCLCCLTLEWPKGRERFDKVTAQVAKSLDKRAGRALQRARHSGVEEDWHRLRLRVKAQRYLKEVCLPDRSWTRERALQDALGEFNDSCSQLKFLRARLDDVDEALRPKMVALLVETEARQQRQLAALNTHSWVDAQK